MNFLEDRGGVVLITTSNDATKTDIMNALSDKMLSHSGLPDALDNYIRALKHCSVTPIVTVYTSECIFQVVFRVATFYFKDDNSCSVTTT